MIPNPPGNFSACRAGGVTTVRDCGGPGLVTLVARDAIASGIVAGPRLIAAGPAVTTTAGHLHFLGARADGTRSSMDINSIIAVSDRSRRYERGRPPVSNKILFARDRHICLYCGHRFTVKELTRDHVTPVSRGGRDVYVNLATSCRACNARKDNRTPEEARMPLLAVPYEPDMASYLLLLASGRRITACQQTFLEALADKHRHQS